MAHLTFQQEYMQMPPVTRAYTTACVFTTMLVQLDFVSPFTLYFNPILIFRNYQVWRLVTTFLFFGAMGFNFLFNMIFTYRYCRMLEEGSFRGRTADFVLMMVFGGVCMMVCALFCQLLFLGQAFTIMLVYVWARRNPFVRMNFFGLLNFQAQLKKREGRKRRKKKRKRRRRRRKNKTTLTILTSARWRLVTLSAVGEERVSMVAVALFTTFRLAQNLPPEPLE